MRRQILLSTLIILSPIAALAGMIGGEIQISLTIQPTCEISIANAKPAVNCIPGGLSQPRISESHLAAVPGIAVGAKLVTIEW